MTNVYLSSREYPGVASAVAIGSFDGFHRGHQEIIRKVRECSGTKGLTTVIYTFRRNPKLRTARIAGLLSTNSERVEYAGRHGILAIVMEDFTSRFQAMDAERFIRDILVARLNAHVVVVGEDFRFGKGRAGDIVVMEHTLEDEGRRLAVVPEVRVGEHSCSSSSIRAMIAGGQVDEAAVYLGRPYAVDGVVVTGNRVGGKLGFPTANIEVPDPVKLLPGNGVYAVRACIDGLPLAGVCNIGVRPTVSTDERRTVEVHLLDFHRQIYGHLARVEFVRRLRDEARFASPAALAAQIVKDIAAARALLGVDVPRL
jgi:riboflavin kinase/FMN adenylyltransferase